ncbi:hypothetical protein CEP10_11380 [Cylindrospermopsis raciborskii S07]|uniref:Ycf49-like protein n=1 Tax=Cylindrospermopsis raciborskii C07 TaxID=2014886 RepID=A0ABX4WHT8_9CYAN|nr:MULTISPECIES: DUF2499 domain-containing protein [Cylindrospermopsis]MBU6346267.1 DUF2499 domain-containing protein [Cyanobacteria bacterium REEB494]KRH98105.1 hypothetical protein ASL19_13640 [Cylindrospermopsis sp. CR12]MBA4444379.1 DUF2499 domain-containing protein [Cylindrospermopsis raciborskii CS-506_C]MCH4903118.1 DUF2499 domain-containing protein [Cylindrospermopsis raciborskii CHAB3438]MEB3146772.1 DUF2499 domain-containing protein [Cylindrospermopsis raciborskii]
MNALSIPTWIIHISSVIEWVVAISLIWKYGELTQNHSWRGFALAMIPALISALSACTWHYFDNPQSLEWLVTLQATTTLIGNFTLWAAAVWVWRSTRASGVLNISNKE